MSGHQGASSFRAGAAALSQGISRSVHPATCLALTPLLHPELLLPTQEAVCGECGSKEATGINEMLLCDFCDDGWHLLCLDPPVTEIPEGDWL